MNRAVFAWLVSAGCLFPCFLAGPVVGQDKEKEKEKSFPVAIVNVDKVFRAYKPLQDKLAPLKADVQEFEKTVQLKQVELETVQQKLVRAAPDSGEGPKLQQQFIKLQAELRGLIEKERKSFAKREAKIHADVYREMEEQVKKLCKARGIKLVVRQSDGALDDEKVEEVLKALNRNIIYAEDLDLTDAVIKAMEGEKS
jgi:Skp family chaperone for outer membrane proteins